MFKIAELIDDRIQKSQDSQLQALATKYMPHTEVSLALKDSSYFNWIQFPIHLNWK